MIAIPPPTFAQPVRSVPILPSTAIQMTSSQSLPRTSFNNKTVSASSGTSSINTSSNENSSTNNQKSFSIDSSRRRRTRCKKCDSCLRADCGDCHFCKDMKKFGGPGRMKQSCIARQCLSPVLPHTACCVICGRDGWEKLTIDPGMAPDDSSSSLMECSQCWEIVHPFCLNGKYPDLFKHNKGFMNKELPNSWECPKCVKSGNTSKQPPSASAASSIQSAVVSTVAAHTSFSSSSSASKSINWSLMTASTSSHGTKESSSSSVGAKRLKCDDSPPPPSSDDDDNSKKKKKKKKHSLANRSSIEHDPSTSKSWFVPTGSTGATSAASITGNNNVLPAYSQPAGPTVVSHLLAPQAPPAASYIPPYHHYHHHHHHQYHAQSSSVLPMQPQPVPPPPPNYLGYPPPVPPTAPLPPPPPQPYQHHPFVAPGSGHGLSSSTGNSAAAQFAGSYSYHSPPISGPIQPIPIHPQTQNLPNPALYQNKHHSPISLQPKNESIHKPLTTRINDADQTKPTIKIASPKQEIEIVSKVETKIEVKIEAESNMDTPITNNDIVPATTSSNIEFDKADQKIAVNGNDNAMGDGSADCGLSIQFEQVENKEATNQTNNVSKEIRKPMFVIRPAPLDEDVSTSEEEEEDDDDSRSETDDDDTLSDTNSESSSQRKIDKQSAIASRQQKMFFRRKISRALRRFNRKFPENLALEKDVVLPVLRHLNRSDLLSCMPVCKLWNEWCCDPSLWKSLSPTNRKINSVILVGIVRRQPRFLDLSWCRLSNQQLHWLICRLPQLQSLKLVGLSAQVVRALHSCHCPRLSSLDLSWVESLCDDLIRCLLSKPSDSRPGLLETKSRLRFLSEFSLAGTLITDDVLRLIIQNLPFIEKLDLSECEMITDFGISSLIIGFGNLRELNLAGCRKITDASLKLFQNSSTLMRFDVRHCQSVTLRACERFLKQTLSSSLESPANNSNALVNSNCSTNIGNGVWKMTQEKLFSRH